MVCQDCGTELTGAFCPGCGKPAQTQSAQGVGPSARSVKVVISIGLCLAALWILVRTSSSPSAQKDPETVLSRGVVCASSVDDEAQLAIASSKNDQDAMAGLLLRKDIFVLKQGTRLRQILTDAPFADVYVESGFYMGKTCWLPESVIPSQ